MRSQVCKVSCIGVGGWGWGDSTYLCFSLSIYFILIRGCNVNSSCDWTLSLRVQQRHGTHKSSHRHRDMQAVIGHRCCRLRKSQSFLCCQTSPTIQPGWLGQRKCPPPSGWSTSEKADSVYFPSQSPTATDDHCATASLVTYMYPIERGTDCPELCFIECFQSCPCTFLHADSPWWWWWILPCMQGFWENVQPFIPCPRLFFLFLKWRLAHTH